jgi:hypothetical protein
MREEVALHRSLHEEEYWKAYRTLTAMIRHMRARAILAHEIREEPSITDQAKDLAIKGIVAELSANRIQMYEALLSFISLATQGLHAVDIECTFLLRDAKAEIGTTRLLVDGEAEDLPAEVGKLFVELILRNAGYQVVEAVMAFYRKEETRYDAMLGGSLNRCSLRVLEEKYPERCVHITIRLPAQTLNDHQVSLESRT